MEQHEIESIMDRFKKWWTAPVAMLLSYGNTRRLCAEINRLKKVAQYQGEEIASIQSSMSSKESSLYEEIRQMKSKLEGREDHLNNRESGLNDKEAKLYEEFCSLKSKLTDKETALFNEVCALRSTLSNRETELAKRDESLSATRKKLGALLEWVRVAHRLSERPTPGTAREVLERMIR